MRDFFHCLEGFTFSIGAPSASLSLVTDAATDAYFATTGDSNQVTGRVELNKVKGSGDHGLNMKGLTFFPEVFNPEKFKMPDIDKYDGTGCPKTHPQLFFSNVGSMGLTQKQMAKIIPRTLSGAAVRWFAQIDKSTLKSWDDIANAFVKQ